MLTFKKFPAGEHPEGVSPRRQTQTSPMLTLQQVRSNGGATQGYLLKKVGIRLLYFVSCRDGVGQRIVDP